MLHRPLPKRSPRLALLGLLLVLAAPTPGRAAAAAPEALPATAPAPAPEESPDPLENVNRAIFRFNDRVVDRFLLRPAGTAYDAVLPGGVRDALRNFFRNLRAPVIFANDVLQGDFKGAHKTLTRFLMNSTLGMGGLVDLAGLAGIPYHYQDFGITFGVWGIKPGPYLVIPVLGPSDPRDLVGNIAEGFADPGNAVAAGYNEYVAIYSRGAVSGIDTYARNKDALDELKRTSVDYYAAIRSIYQQRRAAFIERRGGELPPNPGLAAAGGAVVARGEPLPPPTGPTGPDPADAQLAARPQLYPPAPASDPPTAGHRRIVEGQELFPPPGLVAEGDDGGAASSPQ